MKDEKSIGRVISFLNMKGGVGKTTLAKEVSYYLSEVLSKKVLMIDIDPQSNLTQSFFSKYKIKQEHELENEYNKNYKVSNATIHNVFDFNSIIESPDLEDYILELDDDLHITPGDLNTLFLDRGGSAEKENALSNFIEDCRLQEVYDYIIIDCPPTFSFYTTAALLASDYYISPIQADSYSVLGVDLLDQVIKRLKKIHRKQKISNLEHLGVVFSNIEVSGSRSKGRLKMIEDIKRSDVLKEFGIYIFKDYFLSNPEMSKKIDYFIVDNNSEVSYDNLRKIVNEILKRVEEIESKDK